MKTLIFVRHAKSTWKDPSVDDHERKLNKRGEHDAPAMAKIFSQKKIPVDLIVTSTATRAYCTAKEFAKKLDYEKDKMLKTPELYLADTGEWINYLKKLEDKYNSIMLFGHNPGITDVVNRLSNALIENVPTCGICAIEFPITSWKEIADGAGKLVFFEYPKMYFKEAAD